MLMHAPYFNCRFPNSHVLFNCFQAHKTEITITVFCDMMRSSLVDLYRRYGQVRLYEYYELFLLYLS
jgi:hypothetical protein